MRLFTTIALDKEVKEYLCELQKKIGRNLAKINYISKKNLHLTLKFLGEVDKDKLTEIKKALRKIKYKKFKLKIDKIGVFSNEYSINVIWAGVENESKISELQTKVDEETINLSKEGIKLGGHITLGRIKTIKNREIFLKRIKEIKFEVLEFEVNEFKLIKSSLNKNGPDYEVIDIYSLE